METNQQGKWREHRNSCQVCSRYCGKCPTGAVLSAAVDTLKSPTEERKEAAEAFAESVATIDRELCKAERLINDARRMLDKALEACQAANLRQDSILAAIESAARTAALVGKA